MSFLWPKMLLTLVAIPALVGLYASLQRRRSREAAALAASGLVAIGPGIRLGRRRHVPVVLFLLAITLLSFAAARPQMVLAIPHQSGTVILVFDTSNSMLAEDVAPTRLAAAKAAATEFIESQPSTVKVGLVAFGDGALTMAAPTDDRESIDAAIDRLSANGGTSTGNGLFTALSEIAGKPLALTEEELAGDLDVVDIGFFGSAAIILLSDGENTGGPDPLEIAQLASNAGVRISTIGLGSTEGSVIDIDGYQVSTALDESLLKGVADLTGGTYYRATDAESLAAVYDSIDLEWTRDDQLVEITALLAIGAIAVMLVATALAVRWFGRVI